MTTSTTTGRGIDNRVKSRLNQEKVLLALHRFGWLPVRQVHQACWPDKATPRNAQEYLAQLLELKQVTWKEGADRSRVYALTLQGARRLRVELGVEATHDLDFARRAMPAYLRSAAASWGPQVTMPTSYSNLCGRARSPAIARRAERCRNQCTLKISVSEKHSRPGKQDR